MASSGGVDQPVHGFLICQKCGQINPPDAAECSCRYIFKRPVGLHCPSCAQSLALPPFTSQEFRCPSCSCRFRATRADGCELDLTITFDPKDLLRYYDVLEVAPGVSWDELRTAYRKRVSEYHPDRVSRLGRDLRAVAEEKMKQINEAYSVLAQELRNES